MGVNETTWARRARGVAVASAAALMAFGVAACGSSNDEEGGSATSKAGKRGPIVVATWGGRFEEATKEFIAKPFTEETGIEIKFVAAPGTQVASLQAQRKANNPQWDVMDSLTGEDASFLYANGLLEDLPADLRTQLQSAAPRDSVTDYGLPFANLGHVIVCNMDKVRACPSNMREFFDPEGFPGTRTMSGNHSLVALTLASVANGVPASEIGTTDIDIDSAIAALKRVKPSVKVFWKAGDQMEQLIQTGEVDMGILYSGRTKNLIEEQGLNLKLNWRDGVYNPGFWSVVKGSKQTEAGFELIRWISENPEAQAKWAEFMNYSVPSPEALKLLPQDVASWLADAPENYEVLAKENFDWYVENHREANSAFRELVGG